MMIGRIKCGKEWGKIQEQVWRGSIWFEMTKNKTIHGNCSVYWLWDYHWKGNVLSNNIKLIFTIKPASSKFSQSISCDAFRSETLDMSWIASGYFVCVCVWIVMQLVFSFLLWISVIFKAIYEWSSILSIFKAVNWSHSWVKTIYVCIFGYSFGIGCLNVDWLPIFWP